jgi:hypothetical protein
MPADDGQGFSSEHEDVKILVIDFQQLRVFLVSRMMEGWFEFKARNRQI